jgi:nucleotide-binding universal stress UspA family protein
LAAAFQAQIEVFHVMREDSEKERMALEAKMDQVLKDVDHVYRYVWFPRVGEGIRVGLEESPADLVVMIHHKPTFFESLLKGSNSSQMSVRTQVPLLVLPSPMAC